GRAGLGLRPRDRRGPDQPRRRPGVRVAGSTDSRVLSTRAERVARLARRSPLASVGALIVGLVIVAALAAPLVATTDPIDQDLTVVLKPPFWQEEGSLRHPLGTDHLGRDVYSRLVYGAQISLTISALAALLGALVGVVAGLAAGYLRGRADTI